MKLLPAFWLLALVFCGCAQLTVDVNVLDRKFWSSPEQLSNSIAEQVANMARKRANGEFTRARETINSQARQALVHLAKAGGVDPGDVEPLATKLAKFVNDGFKNADGHFETAFTKLGSASADPKNRLEILFQAQGEVDAGYASIRRVQEQVSADLRMHIEATELHLAISRSKPTVTAAVEPAKQAESKIEAATRGLIGDRGILDDPLASSVVYAPESYWQRPESPHGINNTYAAGTFGNTDIAIKMEAVGDFTIKGVRLDASKITQATFAVARQAINTAAALYGIPLPLGGTKTTTPAAATPFAETPIGFQSPDRRRAEADQALLLRRMARLTVLETILVQREALTNSATTPEAEAARALALKTVKEVFAANRNEINPPAVPNK